MPFGLVSAQDEFQRKIDETFGDLTGTVAIVDDILVHGRTRKEHDANLQAVLSRCRQKNVRLNPDKLSIGVTEVSYFGHLITAEGTKPDPTKSKPSSKCQPPKDKQELDTMLGMITYLAKFATFPFRSHQPNEGTVEAGHKKPVAYASKALTPSEQNYAQIEKELYAILFGCKRYHQCIYGHTVTVESDHKPLESIMKKPLTAAPARLQRMLLQLQKYDLRIVHVAGKDIPVADTLSRKFLTTKDDGMSEEMEAQVHMVLMKSPVSDHKMSQLRDAINNDVQMKQLRTTILNGWPDSRSECPESIIEYWNHRDQLTAMDGLIFKGKNHHSQRPEIRAPPEDPLQSLRMEKCKERARDILFWPGMNAEIEAAVANCTVCLIRKLSVNFARHGIPEILMSDNGPQFASAEFADFASRWDFKHITSSPRYPQSNGLAEKCVQISKNILDKTYKDGIDPLLALLEYRTTPVDNLASRATSDEPTSATADKTWKPAQITRVDPNRSYQVQTADGAQYQRNRRHLKHTPMRNPSSNTDDTPTDLTSVPLQKVTASTSSKPTPSKPMTVTRSGRVVRAPQKLNL
ncbi:uncharacterized protein LOC124278358 [Haliotis rubra]|uniref:uncharacterized protein LOC124278358 n=1 Tax=Haliotis rubra TaxID=36100 RepID=UPI001EE50A99|nr:uncharacterized protein LOC124278358 [Haliotis rubra]